MDRFEEGGISLLNRIIALELPGPLCFPIWYALKKILEVVWHWAAIWMCYITPLTHEDIYEFVSDKLGREPREYLIYFIENGHVTNLISLGILVTFRYQMYALFDRAHEMFLLCVFLFCWFLCFTVYRRDFPFIF